MTDAKILWPGTEPGASTTWWGWLAGELGAQFPLVRPFLIGIRGVALRADATHETIATPAYDDTFVMLSPQPVPPYMFAGATHPYQRDSRESPDVSGPQPGSKPDGRGDVGCIRPGRFELKLAVEDPFPIFTLTMIGGIDKIPCFRDTDHDGRYSAAEISQMSFATAVLFHTGWDAPTKSAHRSSIACQTASVIDLRYLVSHARAFGRVIDYVIEDAETVIDIVKRSPFISTRTEANA